MIILCVVGTTILVMGMGTILYMPPEQLKNVRDIREPADIYVMGVTLYYLLTGEYPYNFPTPEKINKIVKKHGIKDHYMALQVFMRENKIKNPEVLVLTEEPTPIRQRNPNISSSLAGVVDRWILIQYTV
jgi:serine/threonine protein kinase